ncbi:MAG: FAD-dependent oxidoreductase [Euryarchaeota archaeon]|nr:FAD-dependent oxidoreductase [Euryarchaeota archaeon]
MYDRKAATDKAKELVRAAVARAKFLEIVPSKIVSVEPSALVIGGGVAGLTAALEIANQGFKVNVVEMQKDVGGIVTKLNKVSPTNENAAVIIESLIKQVKSDPNIILHTSTTLDEVKGNIGDFEVKLGPNGTKLKAGVIIVATGAQEFTPIGKYGFGTHPNIITQLQLEQLLKQNKLGNPKIIAMIQCVGARETKGRKYCSRICCNTALKNAQLIKEKYPHADVYVCYQDIIANGRGMEEYYLKAQEMGVAFLNFHSNNPPRIEPNGQKISLKIFDQFLSSELDLESDYVVLSCPLVPSPGTKELADKLGLTLSPDGFFEESHPKLGPLDTRKSGIYICGCAQFPKDISDTVAQAKGAASAALIPLKMGQIELELIKAIIDKDACISCAICKRVCPYGAIEMVLVDKKRFAKVNEVLCQGCGICAGACPTGAAILRYYRDKQLIAQLEALLKSEV